MPSIKPSELTAEQRSLDDHVRQLMAGLPAPFTSTDSDGALIGPFPVLLRFPWLTRPLLEWFTAGTGASVLPARVREVAILTTGSRYAAAYELYSHSRVALAVGLPEDIIEGLVAGQRPAGMTDEETVAHDVASRLHSGAPLPGALYRAGIRTFGDSGTAELVFLVAQYAAISTILNAYDVPLPPDGD
ncbi:carboxymuconolactone decarboxylase family protein [Streptomyces sp. NPDC056987]|uniref:carboxymuconolactone decarboxylase family protein n=1 Tax=Streptomyces sp. NPDC056987 TaxID=3345988 RepID=UPI00362DD7A8